MVQEAVASVQALGQAYADYYATVGDYNRAQFRLYRALGEPPAASGRAAPTVGELIEAFKSHPALSVNF